MVEITRVWEMPNADTFSIFPIGRFVQKYLLKSKISIDPFARNCEWFTHTNDLNPETNARHHMDALDYLELMAREGVRCDLGIFDPPYSNRQISECYANVGRKATMEDTQASFYTKIRDALNKIITPDGVVLSFGWHSNGMGIGRGFDIEEIMLVAHGGAHNDTICMAERRKKDLFNV